MSAILATPSASVTTSPRTFPYTLDRRINVFRDCRDFLEKSKAIHAITAFSYMQDGLTFDREGTPNLTFDIDGHPLIKVEGTLMRWQDLDRMLHYDESWHRVRHRDTGQVWTYFNSEQGFMPRDRNSTNLQPIHQLRPDEYTELLTHANRFFETTTDPHPEVPKTAVLQIVSHHEALPIERPEIWDDVPICVDHFSFRIITADGAVYSFGVEMDGRFVKTSCLTGTFNTSPGLIAQLDYCEFRSNMMDQKVTSIPVSMDTAGELFDMVHANEHLRFCFLYQNCSSVTASFLETAGYEPPQRQYMPVFVFNFFSALLFPDLTRLPLVGPVIAKVVEFVKSIFNAIAERMPQMPEAFHSAVTIILYVPRKIATLFFNTLILALGASQYSGPPIEGPEDILTSDLTIKKFNCVIANWSDLFNDGSATVFHSQKFKSWQDEQASTVFYEHTPRPRFCLMPVRV